MAVVYGNKIGISGGTSSQYWKAALSYSGSNTSNTVYTVKLKCGFKFFNTNYSGTASRKINIGGSSKTFGTGTSWKVSTDGTEYYYTRTLTYDRTTSDRTVTINYSAAITSGSYASGTSSGSITVTIPHLPAYNISFNANGGSGTVNSKTKYYGVSLTLPSSGFTRAGHELIGWGTASGATTVTYALGSTYTSNPTGGATLYAVWKKLTSTLTFNPNGGSGGTTTGTAYVRSSGGSPYTFPSATNEYGGGQSPTRKDCYFLGWSTSASATTPQYGPGYENFYTDSTAPITFYAVWKTAYIPMSITNINSVRTSGISSSQSDEEGGYGCVNIGMILPRKKALNSASADVIIPVKIDIYVKAHGDASFSNTPTKTFSNWSTGTVGSGVIFSTAALNNNLGSLSGSISYDIKIEITDTFNSVKHTSGVFFDFISASSEFIIDINADATAIGLFNAAPDNVQEKGVYIGAKTYINGQRLRVIPAGIILPYAGVIDDSHNPPDGWLICDGRAVSRTEYADLFNAIGTTYGAGNGSTTFNLPNSIGKGLFGTKAGDGEFRLGYSGGSKTHTPSGTVGGHTLTTNEIPAHTHGSSGEHQHASYKYTSSKLASGTVGARIYDPAGSNGEHTMYTPSGKGAHTHTSVGGGASHNHSFTGTSQNTMPPYLTVNFIISY